MKLLRGLALAGGTLTVLRLPVRGDVPAEELRRSTALYPLVGVGVGAVPALLLLLPLPPLVRAAAALSGWVLVTGALHLDGWADCCDAAFAPPLDDERATRERRLAILKDPHLGTFGVVGIFLLLLGKWTALAYSGAAAPLFAAVVARWSMVLALRVHPPARDTGMGSAFAGAVPLGAATLVLALVAGAMLMLLPSERWPLGGASLLAGAAAGAGVAAILARRFGGVTGDVCGAAGEAAELATLWALLPWGFA